MEYKSTVLRPSAVVHRVISIHYFEYMSDFSFPGESHDFLGIRLCGQGSD